MGALFFVCGSATGAALAWFVGQRERSRPLIAAFNGVSCGLLGIVTALDGGTMAPMAQAGFGFLSAAAPLTLCTSIEPLATSAGVAASIVRGFSATLGLALVYGIGCAALGFVSAAGVWHVAHGHSVGEAAADSLLSPTHSDALPRGS